MMEPITTRVRNTSFSRGFFPSSDFWQSEDVFATFLTSTPKKAALSQTNSIQCLFCAELFKTSDRIAVFGALAVGFARNSARF